MPTLVLQLLMIVSLISSGSVQPNALFFILAQGVLSLALITDGLVNLMPREMKLPKLFHRRALLPKLNNLLSSLQTVAGLSLLLGYTSSLSLFVGGVLAVVTLLSMLLFQRKYSPTTGMTAGLMMLMLSGSLLVRTLTA